MIAFSSSRSSTGGPGSAPRPWTEWFALGFAPIVILVGHLVFGATARSFSMILVAVAAILLLSMLISSENRRALATHSIGPQAWSFLAVLGVAVFTLTPWTPGGANPAWLGIPGPGASTLDRSATLSEIVKLLGLACFFGLGVLQAGRSHRLRMTIKIMLFAGGLVSLGLLLNFLVGAELGQGNRFTGFFPSANVAGDFFAIHLVISASWLVERLNEERVGRLEARVTRLAVPATLCLLFCVCLGLTASRGACLATAAALSVLLVWSGFSKRRQPGHFWMIAAISGIGVILLIIGLSDTLLARIGPDSLLDEGRILLVTRHWDAFLRSPLFGYGLGTFSEINRQLLTSETYAALWRMNATHNVYLQWLEEAGIAGSVSMAVCILTTVAIAVKNLVQRRDGGGWLRALVLADIVILMHGFTDFTLQVYSMAAGFAFILGLQSGVSGRK